jgi:hypothetical protein
MNEVDREHRKLIGEQISDGYDRFPETDEEMAEAEASGKAMIFEEPW